MKVIIQFSVREEAKALPILLRHSPGMVLPERTYVLGEEAIGALREAGVRFTELSREADALSRRNRDLPGGHDKSALRKTLSEAPEEKTRTRFQTREDSDTRARS
jgi:hypothetical protein